MHAPNEIYYLDLFIYRSFASPIHVRYFFLFTKMYLSPHRHPRFTIIIISFECIHYMLAVTTRNRRKSAMGRNRNVFADFFISRFYLHCVIEQAESGARACAIPMLMRNAAETLPSELYVHVARTVLTYNETDHNRRICFSHSNIRYPSLTKQCLSPRIVFQGLLNVCMLAEYDGYFFQLFFPLLVFFSRTNAHPGMRVVEMRTLQSTSVGFCRIRTRTLSVVTHS